MSKKIKPNLSGMLRPNSDSNAMLKALEGSRPQEPATPSAPSAPEDIAVWNGVIRHFDAMSMTAADLKVGQVYDLPLSLLSRSDNNARVYYNPGEVEEMAESLATKGQDVPAIGYVSDSKVVIVDGQKRFNACTQGKLATLRVTIRQAPQSEAEEYETSRRINVSRSTQTAFDDAIRWQQLLEKKVYESQDDLAQRLGLSKSTVSKTLGLNRIPQSLRRMMAESPHTSGMTVAYEISNIFSSVEPGDADRLEAMAEEVINTVNKKELGRVQTIELVRSKLEGRKTRLRGESLAVKFGQHKGSIKVVPTRGEFSMSFRGLSEPEIEDLKQKIQALLEPRG